MNFTLVSTVFNESKRLKQTIKNIQQQSVQPSEIIITDAGSTDGTFEMLLSWKKESTVPITILQKNKCSVAVGRNIAIRAAQSELIVSMDFGCEFHPNWLKSITDPFSDTHIKVVGGAYTVDENQQDTLPAKAAFIMANGYNADVHSENYLPSSRSIAYKKDVFEKIGGYKEWLTLAGDDTIFALEIKAHGYDIYIAKEQYVKWGRHKTLKAFLKEVGRYGLGEGEAKLNFNMLIRFITAVVCQTGFIVLLLLLWPLSYFHLFDWKIIILFLILAIGLKPCLTIFNTWLKYKSSKFNFPVLAYAFYMQFLAKVTYIKSYIKGYFFSSGEKQNGAKELKMILNKKK